jgi:serine/threonine protein kinase
MPAPTSAEELLGLIRKSNQIEPSDLDPWLEKHAADLPREPKKLAALMRNEGLITQFQAEQFLLGKYKGFQLGGYRLIERLGSGGTGTVYLAEHEVMKRPVALKVLPVQIASDPATLARFQREAQAVAALDHENIVRAYDFRKEQSLYVFVMEFVDGPSLQQVLDNKGALDVDVACDYIRQAALGLHYAHQVGMVHRDVKPANLLVDSAGTIKVLDLGLARFVPEGQESVTKKFDEGNVMGTADYIAPEQALNLHNVDHRADIYSLGATLYTLLAGHTPFPTGTMTQKLLWHQMREPDPLETCNASVPKELADLVALMMAKNPDQRFQTALEVAEALEPFSAEEPTPQPNIRIGAAVKSGKTSVRLRNSGKQYTPVGVDRPTGRLSRPPAKKEVASTQEQAGPPTKALSKQTKAPAQSQSSGAIWLLIAALLIFILFVGGIIAFLVYGPSPNAVHTSRPEDKAEKEKLPSKDGQTTTSPGSLYSLTGHRGGVQSVAYSGEGGMLVSGGADRTIRVWNLLTRKNELTISNHNDTVHWVSFNTAGDRILSASADGTARIFEFPSGREVRVIAVGQRVWSAIFGKNENEVLTAGDDRLIKLWNVRDGKMIRAIKGHTNTINWLAYRPGVGNEAISVSLDKSLRLWQLDSGKTLQTIKEENLPTCVAVDGEGKLALVGDQKGTVHLHNLQSRQLLGLRSEHSEPVTAVAISTDGNRLLSAAGPTIIQWDVRHFRNAARHIGHQGAINSLAISPNGKRFASCSSDQTIHLWKMTDG